MTVVQRHIIVLSIITILTWAPILHDNFILLWSTHSPTQHNNYVVWPETSFSEPVHQWLFLLFCNLLSFSNGSCPMAYRKVARLIQRTLFSSESFESKWPTSCPITAKYITTFKSINPTQVSPVVPIFICVLQIYMDKCKENIIYSTFRTKRFQFRIMYYI